MTAKRKPKVRPVKWLQKYMMPKMTLCGYCSMRDKAIPNAQ